MAFVGNGFDLQVMTDFRSSVDTRYESFYHFLRLRSFNEQNPILVEMELLLEAGKSNWSDIEDVVSALLARKPSDAGRLAAALRELQGEFSEFLDLAVSSSLLERVGSSSMKERLAVTSLQEFLGDLDDEEYRGLEFPKRVDNFDVFNFLFVNFNYTSLLDDLVYLDQVQFDPLPYKTVDRNFTFAGNPGGVRECGVRPGDTFSSYVVAETVHPHGHLSIPRSLLFGIDTPPELRGNQDPALRLAKPFWAQNERRYEHLFDDTELFIVFGCSLGTSDRWWWSRIASALNREVVRPHRDHHPRCTVCRTTTTCSSASGSTCRSCSTGIPCGRRETYVPELILYWWSPDGHPQPDKDELRRVFLSAAGPEFPEELGERIHVVPYAPSSDRVWLSTVRGRPTDQ